MTTTEISPDAYGRSAATSVRRFANDSVAEIAERLDDGDGSAFEFICECGDLGCREMVAMTLTEYRTRKPGSVVGHD